MPRLPAAGLLLLPLALAALAAVSPAAGCLPGCAKIEGEDEAQRLSLKKKLLATWTWQDLGGAVGRDDKFSVEYGFSTASETPVEAVLAYDGSADKLLTGYSKAGSLLKYAGKQVVKEASTCKGVPCVQSVAVDTDGGGGGGFGAVDFSLPAGTKRVSLAIWCKQEQCELLARAPVLRRDRDGTRSSVLPEPDHKLANRKTAPPKKKPAAPPAKKQDAGADADADAGAGAGAGEEGGATPEEPGTMAQRLKKKALALLKEGVKRAQGQCKRLGAWLATKGVDLVRELVRKSLRAGFGLKEDVPHQDKIVAVGVGLLSVLLTMMLRCCCCRRRRSGHGDDDDEDGGDGAGDDGDEAARQAKFAKFHAEGHALANSEVANLIKSPEYAAYLIRKKAGYPPTGKEPGQDGQDGQDSDAEEERGCCGGCCGLGGCCARLLWYLFLLSLFAALTAVLWSTVVSIPLQFRKQGAAA